MGELPYDAGTPACQGSNIGHVSGHLGDCDATRSDVSICCDNGLCDSAERNHIIQGIDNIYWDIAALWLSSMNLIS